MLKDKLTLLIHSCDKFSDLWPTHIKLLNQNWPDRGIRTILLTDKPRDDKYEGVELIGAGVGKEITERIRHVLPLIDTEYVLVTLDDYFVTTPIDTARIARLVEIMEREHYDYIRLYDRPHCPLTSTAHKDIYTYTLDHDYRVNLYSGIWRKDFIERTLGDKELNAWEFEVTLTERAHNANGNCAVSHGKEFPILDVVRKGKILPKAWQFLKHNNLYDGDRSRMPYVAYFKLGIKEIGSRVLLILPTSFYQYIKKICVAFGMKSFSATNNK